MFHVPETVYDGGNQKYKYRPFKVIQGQSMCTFYCNIEHECSSNGIPSFVDENVAK